MNLRFVLLALLSRGPNTGYALSRQLDSQLDHLWDAYVQQIYTELAKLEQDGAVSVEPVDLHNRPTKKIYSLTAAGHEALDKWLRRRPASIQHKDELRVKLYCLDRMPPELAVRHFEERLDEHQAKVRELRRRLADADLDDIGYQLSLEAALSHEEGQASWCEKAMAYLNGAQPAPSRKRPAPAAASRR